LPNSRSSSPSAPYVTACTSRSPPTKAPFHDSPRAAEYLLPVTPAARSIDAHLEGLKLLGDARRKVHVVGRQTGHEHPLLAFMAARSTYQADPVEAAIHVGHGQSPRLADFPDQEECEQVAVEDHRVDSGGHSLAAFVPAAFDQAAF